MSDISLLAGQTLPAGKLRALAPSTLLLSGTKTIPNGAAVTTLVDTLGVVVDSSEIAYTLNGGGTSITLTDGGLFLVSIVGVFATSGTGTVRLICARGSIFGSARLAPATPPPGGTSTTGFGCHPTGAIPIPIQPGEIVDVVGRQDSGGNLSVTAWLGLTRLAQLA